VLILWIENSGCDDFCRLEFVVGLEFLRREGSQYRKEDDGFRVYVFCVYGGIPVMYRV